MILALLLQSALAFANDNGRLYMKDATATELRATGTVKAMCDDVKAHPRNTFMDVRLVNSTGEIYMYKPEVGTDPKFLLGTVDPDGNFSAAEFFQQSLGTIKVHVIRDAQSLTFIYSDGAKTFGESWVATTAPEVSRYYAAQDACRGN